MKASVVDLRYRMNEILKALDRNEDVSILCRGKLKGIIKAARGTSGQKVSDHPFFNMLDDNTSVEEVMGQLRGGRYLDIWHGCLDLGSAGKWKGGSYYWQVSWPLYFCDDVYRIMIDPNVCQGQPTLRGMRITVSVVLKMLTGGKSVEDVIKAYPEIEAEDVHQAMQYAAWVVSDQIAAI
jgi:uncharacterized protein (DUF433 family)